MFAKRPGLRNGRKLIIPFTKQLRHTSYLPPDDPE